ncbi:hypothetical protein IFM89_022640 [Coptis chinensis]|uniref:Uncharacterized protein n=1 Tax=Coptis chinensis TaxID=261450 RepID=A0A835LBI0_9MAGN|nr:hypothetical protein IFM89_022640 [Coptis chinensis]
MEHHSTSRVLASTGVGFAFSNTKHHTDIQVTDINGLAKSNKNPPLATGWDCCQNVTSSYSEALGAIGLEGNIPLLEKTLVSDPLSGDQLREVLTDEERDMYQRYAALFALQNRCEDVALGAIVDSLGARSALRNMRDLFDKLEGELLEYYGLKEQKSNIVELQRQLKIKTVEINMLNISINSLQAKRKKLQEEIAEGAAARKELEMARNRIKELQRYQDSTFSVVLHICGRFWEQQAWPSTQKWNWETTKEFIAKLDLKTSQKVLGGGYGIGGGDFYMPDNFGVMVSFNLERAIGCKCFVELMLLNVCKYFVEVDVTDCMK